MKISSLNLLGIWLLSCCLANAQNFIDILPGGHNVPITEVNYLIDGTPFSQTSEAAGVVTRRDAPANLTSVKVNDGGTVRTLNSFNTLGGKVANLNLTTQTTGVGVFDNGMRTETQDLASFSDKLAGITQDTDLLNYSYYDFAQNLPNSQTSDYDLLFARGFESQDFVLVSERFGNTHFAIVPLGADGSPIAGANTLRFGGAWTLGEYEAYDWNSGYASETYITDQAFGFSVAKVEKFFENTQASPQTVFGFRIDNNGDADVKFFGLSDNDFANNPENPLLPPPTIPEPSGTLLSLLGLSLLSIRRRRGA